jgi:integrase/recombinase XerC
MTVVVKRIDGSHRLEGTWAGAGSANAFLSHLEARRFSPATVRAYAFDVMCLARFLEERGIDLSDLVPTDVFDWVDWQSSPRRRGSTVVSISAGWGAAPASVNRRVAAARACFEYLMMIGVRADNPVAAPRRGQGLRPKSRGLLGHLGPGRVRGGGRLVRQTRRLPESLDPADVSLFLAGLGSHRDRASCWRCCVAGCEPERSAGSCSPTSTRDAASCAWWARAAGNGWSPWMTRSSPSLPPTSPGSGRPGLHRRSDCERIGKRMGAALLK